MEGARRYVPSFLLYGDQPSQGAPPFVHIESIAARSQALNWRIEPHRHDSLGHILLIRSKGGRFLLDDVWHDFAAGVVIAIPSTLVHGFLFQPHTDGLVLTLSDQLSAMARDDLGDPGLAAGLTRAHLVDLADSRQGFDQIDSGLQQIQQELAQPRIGQLSAIRNHIGLVTLTLLRHDLFQDKGSFCSSPDLDLVDRLRPLIAGQLQDRAGVGHYAEQLGVTNARLNQACRRVTGCSTLHLLHAAILAEAKRGLLYSARPISDIAYDLGFDDPAYFSRFFTRRAGRTPTQFRAQHIVA